MAHSSAPTSLFCSPSSVSIAHIQSSTACSNTKSTSVSRGSTTRMKGRAPRIRAVSFPLLTFSIRYETISDLMRLQDQIDSFQKLIFAHFRGATNNECRISALVPQVKESYGIYRFITSMLRAMHRSERICISPFLSLVLTERSRNGRSRGSGTPAVTLQCPASQSSSLLLRMLQPQVPNRPDQCAQATTGVMPSVSWMPATSLTHCP
jgi:hypothetical protein